MIATSDIITPSCILLRSNTLFPYLSIYMSSSVHQWLEGCQLTTPGTPNPRVDTNRVDAATTPFPSTPDAFPDSNSDIFTSSWTSTSTDEGCDVDENHYCALDSSTWAYEDNPLYYVSSKDMHTTICTLLLV